MTTKADQQRAAILAPLHARLGRYLYGNGKSRQTLAQLDSSGIADCSDVSWATYDAQGIDIGGMSYQQAEAGTQIAAWTGTRGAGIAAFLSIVHLVKPADLIVMGLDKTRPHQISHVEVDKAGTTSIGHGGPGRGPTINSLISMLRYADRWEVRRIIHDTTTKPAPTPTTESDNDMLIIKSPNRPAALIGPGCFHKFRNSEEQAVTLTVVKPETRTVNDRQYDVCRAVILGGALDSTQTRADLAELLAALDKDDANA